MFFKCIPKGMFASNCYIVGDSAEGVIIDAGVDPGEIIPVLDKNNIRLKYIILTHGHIDHICFLDGIRAKTGALAMIHKDDAEALSNSLCNGSALFGSGQTFKAADRLLQDREILEAGGMKFEIIHTPGHSPGSICIKTGNILFTGDTLFRLSVGRTDLGNGSHEQLMRSIKNKILTLDTATTVYPGHGASTTIGFERSNNPFL